MANKAIARYIEKNCANYDANGQCLLQTFEGSHICPLFYGLQARCNYAESSVLPGDPHIQALYEQGKQGGAEIVLNTCERCKKPYKRKSNRQKYCSSCQTDQSRKRAREGMQKKRGNVNV